MGRTKLILNHLLVFAATLDCYRLGPTWRVNPT
jgi:hypothetical protein